MHSNDFLFFSFVQYAFDSLTKTVIIDKIDEGQQVSIRYSPNPQSIMIWAVTDFAHRRITDYFRFSTIIFDLFSWPFPGLHHPKRRLGWKHGSHGHYTSFPPTRKLIQSILWTKWCINSKEIKEKNCIFDASWILISVWMIIYGLAW